MRFSHQCILIASLLLISTESIAHRHNYKDEAMFIPCPLVLFDGFYLGVAAGYDSYRVNDDLNYTNPANGTLFQRDPVLDAAGPVGGAFVGYGMVFWNFHRTYLGIELFGNGSAGEARDQIIAQTPGLHQELETQVKIKSSYGISLLPGIKLTKGTLLYARLGYNWSHIDVDEVLINNGDEIINQEEIQTTQGFNYGIGVESAALCEYFSVRLEYSHTAYHSYDTDIGTHINPTSNQFMASLIYHFV